MADTLKNVSDISKGNFQTFSALYYDSLQNVHGRKTTAKAFPVLLV
uniref:Uncharacterized protein n=1 Tax=Arundo donax TaxID=35708 RepID=A0A0A8ZDK6_ARUDO